MHTCPHTHTHTHTCPHTHTNSHTPIYKGFHKHILTRTEAYTDNNSLPNTHTHTHARTRTHAHARTHTSHTHAQCRDLVKGFVCVRAWISSACMTPCKHTHTHTSNTLTKSAWNKSLIYTWTLNTLRRPYVSHNQTLTSKMYHHREALKERNTSRKVVLVVEQRINESIHSHTHTHTHTHTHRWSMSNSSMG